jgi:hypothetical protein
MKSVHNQHVTAQRTTVTHGIKGSITKPTAGTFSIFSVTETRQSIASWNATVLSVSYTDKVRLD